MQSISNVFDSSKQLYISSIKPNIGHLEGAAGIAGVFKAILCLHKRSIPPSVHCGKFNPRIEPYLEKNIKITTNQQASVTKVGTLYAGISSFTRTLAVWESKSTQKCLLGIQTVSGKDVKIPIHVTSVSSQQWDNFFPSEWHDTFFNVFLSLASSWVYSWWRNGNHSKKVMRPRGLSIFLQCGYITFESDRLISEAPAPNLNPLHGWNRNWLAGIRSFCSSLIRSWGEFFSSDQLRSATQPFLIE